MAEIIDNVKVGLFIKSLLKEKQMTQDDLAKTLNITKAAVSQNLNGKSAFDIQNLVKIAELFKLSLDDLIAGRKPENHQDIDSEYLRVIKRGLQDFKAHAPHTLNIGVPDVYGKYFIDYLLDQSLNEWIQYIVEQKIIYVKPTDQYHRVITEKLILYVLRNQLTSPEPLILTYASLYGQLSFAQVNDFQEFLLLLEKQQPTNLIRKLFTDKIKYVKPQQLGFIKWTFTQHNLWMNQLQLLDEVIHLKLIGIWTLWVDTFIREKEFYQIERYFSLLAKADFLDGLKVLLDKMPSLNRFQVFQSPSVKEALKFLVKSNQQMLIDLAVKKNLVDSFNDLALMAIESHQDDMLNHVIVAYQTRLQAKKLITPLALQQGFALIEKHPTFFNQDVLSYALDHLPIEQATPEILNGLIKIGAQFHPQYMNRFTAEKVNRLLNKTKKGKN